MPSPNQHIWLSAKMNGTKKDTGNSMKNVLQYAKRHSWAKGTSNGEKLKSVT